MNGKERLLMTLGIIGIIAAALFTSFGRNLFYLNIPNLVLPDISATGDSLHSEADWLGMQDTHSPVSVTTDSVQGVISALQRADSYFQEIEVELFWEGGSSSTSISVWCDDGWVATQQKLPSGLVRYDLVGDATRYYWYDNSRSWSSASADGSSADLAQHIPTYEDVVELDSSDILSASYQMYGTHSTIYVEAQVDTSLCRYWVSTQTGLLLAAEVEEEGTLIYRLTADGEVQIPCPSSAPFALPDGTSIENLG